MQNLEFIKFHTTNIPCVVVDEKIWVAVRPIAESIGLHVQSAQNNIKSDEILGAIYGEHRILDASNREFPMICLPIEYLNGWLFGIDAVKCKPEARAKLLLYKKECYQALYQHFFGKFRTIEANIQQYYQAKHKTQAIDRQISALLKQRKELEKVMKVLENENFAQLKLTVPIEYAIPLLDHAHQDFDTKMRKQI